MQVNYKKIRADFKYATKGRFFRTFLVREDISLGELGEMMTDILGGTMEHYFMFRDKNRPYIPSSWFEYCPWEDKDSRSIKESFLSDLADNFIFIYDTGDGWDFDCKIYSTIVVKEISDDEEIPTGFVIDGKGMGIWEDHIRSLYAYLDGEIDKDYNGEDENRGIYKPWNFIIDKYSEFDDPIDLEELNDKAMYFFPTAKERY